MFGGIFGKLIASANCTKIAAGAPLAASLK